MNAKNTPGPWRLEIPEEGKVLILGSKSKRYVANVQVTQYPRAMGLLDEPERIANAHLIAAAPELLEIAISNAEYRAARDHEFGRGYNAAKNGQRRDVQKESAGWYEGYDARTAIAKATGEPQ